MMLQSIVLLPPASSIAGRPPFVGAGRLSDLQKLRLSQIAFVSVSLPGRSPAALQSRTGRERRRYLSSTST